MEAMADLERTDPRLPARDAASEPFPLGAINSEALATLRKPRRAILTNLHAHVDLDYASLSKRLTAGQWR